LRQALSREARVALAGSARLSTRVDGAGRVESGPMRALRLLAHGRPGRFEVGVVPDPAPRAGEVRVRVGACGLNRLDLWVEEGGLPLPIVLPRIPGCEAAGQVETVGAGVTAWQPGDRVALQSNLFCGDCEFCRRGEESLCLHGELLGVQRDGGFAERVCVPERALVAIPAGVTLETSAALTLAGSTAMHMLTARASVKPGDWVLVMGAASGVGSAGIQIAVGLGARVITTGTTPEKRALGARLGATAALDPADPAWPAQVRKLTDRRGVDLVLEHVGGPVLEQVFNCLARGGTVVTCGATAGRTVNLNLWPFFVKEQRLVGSYGRNRRDMAATLQWAADGRLKPVIHATWPLAEAPPAYAALRAGQVLGKLLIRPE
jgi:NADPH:quinone reductase-like Zn-dependent oxidoreductase